MITAERKRAGDADEEFELEQQLGVGGFAHTYRALILDEKLVSEYGTNTVAVKIPLNKQKERALKREVEMNIILRFHLKSLLNLVNYLDMAVYRGQMVMVMEYVKGGSLRDRLGECGRQRPLPVADAVEIAEGVLTGLTAIHSERVFHRDIKPENILMDGRIPKVSDLGLARILESGKNAFSCVGTEYYMSPEILGEGGASQLSDIWSVGVTLYEMVTGKLPFGGPETPKKTIINNICFEDPKPVCSVRPEVPGALSEVIVRALQKDRSLRYQSAEQMIADLKELRKGPENEVEKEIIALRAASGISPQALERRLRALANNYTHTPSAWSELGEFLNSCQRYSEAAEAFRGGIKYSPNHALLHFDLGLALMSLGKRAEAAEILTTAIHLGLEPNLQRHAQTLLAVVQGGRN